MPPKARSALTPGSAEVVATGSPSPVLESLEINLQMEYQEEVLLRG